MKAREKWDLLVLNIELKKFREIVCIKKLTFSMSNKNTDFLLKLAFPHYFHYLTWFKIYSIGAARKTESKKCISKQVK
jgi:hypothetical protein